MSTTKHPDDEQDEDGGGLKSATLKLTPPGDPFSGFGTVDTEKKTQKKKKLAEEALAKAKEDAESKRAAEKERLKAKADDEDQEDDRPSMSP